MEDLISIIMPAYNVESYVGKALDSLLNQTYHSIEIIVINDGSKDNTQKVVERYTSMHDNIVLYNKENAGVAAARNDGLKLAHGAYITFVDSDDTVSTTYCEDMIKTANNYDSQIVLSGIQEIYDISEAKEDTSPLEIETYTNIEMLKYLFIHSGNIDAIGAKLFKKELFDGIAFPSGRRYEDSSTLYKLYAKAQNVSILNRKNYYYLREREGSVTASFSYSYAKQKDNYLAISERYKYMIENFPEVLEDARIFYIRNILTLLERTYLSGDEELMKSDIVERIIEEMMVLYSEANKELLNLRLNSYKLSLLHTFLINPDCMRDTIRIIKQYYK